MHANDLYIMVPDNYFCECQLKQCQVTGLYKKMLPQITMHVAERNYKLPFFGSIYNGNIGYLCDVAYKCKW